MGAFASFFTSVSGYNNAAAREMPKNAQLVQIGISEPAASIEPPNFELEYKRALVIGGEKAADLFRQSIIDIAAGPADRIFVLGDGVLRVFEPDGKPVRSGKAPEGSLCIAVDAAERTYFGAEGRIEILNSDGTRAGGFPVLEKNQPALITAIKVSAQELYLADATAKLIRRYALNGKQLGVIGAQGKVRGFMLPNKSLDIALDAKGVLHAADSGRHRISSWKLDGERISQFGKFGLTNPADFVGCCNPVNIAVLPDGNIVAAEKVAARVKVYSPGGKLLALISRDNFDPKCAHLHLAVDSQGRILVADPVRRIIQVFAAANRAGGGNSL